ncbi:MAG TPA: hypothetical protein VHS81_01700 [Caulobacteraceae bacterium]|nr:hypothetical protein [Caulobacteraceae bacterium]
MSGEARTAVLGFRPHTYWTAAVALSGDPHAPDVIARRRIDFASGDERGVYHHVEGMDGEAAQAWIDKVWAVVEANCRRGLGALLEELGKADVTLGVAVVPIARTRPPEMLEDILKSHSWMHAAEGDFYRDAVASACTALGLEVRRGVERDFAADVCRRHAFPAALLDGRMKAIGAALGPPWSEDQKLATLAAWSQLG